MKYLAIFFPLLIFTNATCFGEPSGLINFEMTYHDKNVPSKYVFNSKEGNTFSRNCYTSKMDVKNCIARQRLKKPIKNEILKLTKINASIPAKTCEYHLKGSTIYLKSQDNTLEGFCYFIEDSSAVSLPTIRNKYKNSLVR